MADATPAAEELRLEMRRVRSEMDTDVHGLVENARTMVDQAKRMVDWRYYLRNHPWTCLGAAAAVGFFLVPQRAKIFQATPTDLAKLLKSKGMVVKVDEPLPASERAGAAARSSLTPLVNLAVGILMQRAATMAERQVTQLFSGSRGSHEGGAQRESGV